MRSRNAWSGLAVWLLAAAWLHPSPLATDWAVLLLLFAPLVILPLGLGLALRDGSDSPWLRSAVRLQFPAACALVAAFALPPGWWAAALALPWLGVTAAVAMA